MEHSKPRVLMVAPGRKVMGGISSVVNSYYDLGMDKKVDLKCISSMEDGNKIKKLIVAVLAYMSFSIALKRYDIVHIHMAAQASFDRKALFIKRAKRAGKKIIIHQHAADFEEYFFEQSDEEKRERIKSIFGMADRVIVLSDTSANFFGKNICAPEKLVVLYNGVILPDYEKKIYSDHNVLFLGRLGERKGSYDLLKAIPQIVQVVPDARFYLGGDGDVEQIKKIVLEQGLSDQVKLLGWVKGDQKKQLLELCSTFILPSYHEGMPMAVLEAMSYGLATVSTNAGGIPQIIENGTNGIRIEAGDIQAISDALIDLLKHPEKKKALGIAGRKRIEENFNAAGNINKLMKIYCAVQG